jgi:hypothetical protein
MNDPLPTTELRVGALELRLNSEGDAAATDEGLFMEGVRLLGRYGWRFLDDEAVRVVASEQLSDLELRSSSTLGEELVLIERQLKMRPDGLSEHLELSNPTGVRRSITFEFELHAGGLNSARVQGQQLIVGACGHELRLSFDALAAVRPDGADWELSLAPGERVSATLLLTVA